MPDSTVGEVYNTPQINIPPTFPFILKQYAKAAIRTQPYDLLRWSAAYFRALAKGEEPPMKDRLEYPPPDTPSGLSPGYLKVLIKQIGKGGMITVGQLFERWNGICLAEEPLHEMLIVGRFGDSFDWLHFVAVAAGFLTNSLTQTMVLLCNLLTDEPDGGSAMIPVQIFTKLYTFLASLDCGGPHDNDEEDENHHAYVMTEGSLKRESVESCPTDPSIYNVDWESSAHQIFVENHSPFPSPPISRPCTPLLYSENTSTSTLRLRDQKIQCTLEANKEILLGECSSAPLQTFYDASTKSSESSQEVVTDTIDNKMHKPKAQNASPFTPSTAEKSNVEEEPKTQLDSSKSSSSQSNTLGGIEDKNSLESSSQEHLGTVKTIIESGSTMKRHIPGIGPVVDTYQVQAVMDYLEGMASKQDGMVKPSNIWHFQCPPLEKVPISQKTKV